ncbi:MAG: hypothetical protein AAF244_02275 [Pseudomonadota bacterium]
MLKEKSLHQIMNEIVQRIDTLEPSFAGEQDDFGHFRPTDRQQAQLRGDQDPLSEVEAFIQLDDVLAHLYKQFLEAKAYRQQLTAENGIDDPMTEIAIDMEDSAYCAFQTKYIELRQIREMMARAQRLMRESKEALEREKTKEREEKYKNFIMLSKMQEKTREQNMRGGFEYAILLLMFNLLPTHYMHNMPQHQFKQKMVA